MYSACSFLIVLNLQFSARADGDKLRENDLLDAIKQNLRRNNDDYVEFLEKNHPPPSSTIRSRGNNSENLPKFGKKVSTEAETKNITINKIINNRRANDEPWELNYKQERTSTVRGSALRKSDDLIVKNVDAMSKHSLIMRSGNEGTEDKIVQMKRNLSRLSDTNLRMSPNDTLRLNPKSKNRKKKDTFKKFLSKNKDLFKGSVGSKFEARTKNTQSDEYNGTAIEELLTKNALRNAIKAAEKGDRGGKLPDPEVLDMAPARGGRIHKLRVKGRLCARHVLLPEGPKYDSSGRWYVPAHGPVARPRYGATRRPRLLLPRCCNCCKKAVLGCE